MRRIVIVVVAALLVLALALQTSIAMAAPRLDRAVAGPRWERAWPSPTRRAGSDRRSDRVVAHLVQHHLAPDLGGAAGAGASA